jgi:hypothetical protein
MTEALRLQHNELVVPIIKALAKPVVDAGGDIADVLILLESVIAGVVVFTTRQWPTTTATDDLILDTLMNGVRRRLKDYRAAQGKPFDA